MATKANLFNFYRRYLWNEEDFGLYQEGMVNHTRGLAEGIVSSAVMSGMSVEAGTGLSVDVAEGVAVGPTGYLHINSAVANVPLTAPTTNPTRSLIVSRPLLVDNTYIIRPTTPFDSVPLNVEQDSEIVLIEGTEASSPTYPSTESGDVILAGIRLEPGQSSVSDVDIDYEVRDIPGKNTDIGQYIGRYDDRCRSYRSSNQVMTIKPSQLNSGRGRAFFYVDRSTISKFPRNSSNEFNFADTLVDFENGTVTGGDEQTADFTPSVPSAGNAIVATVSLQVNDQLSIVFGTEGTRAECLDAIINQRNTGAGGLNLPSDVARLAFVIISSWDGVSVTELDVLDARSNFYFGGSVEQRQTVAYDSSAATGYTPGQNDRLVLVTMSGASGFTVSLDDVANYPVDTEITIKRIGSGTGTLTVDGYSSQKVENALTQTIDDERDTLRIKPYNGEWYEV